MRQLRFLLASVRDFGVVGTLDQLPSFVFGSAAARLRRKTPRESTPDAFDREHGTDTAGTLTGHELGPRVTRGGHLVTRYQTTSSAAIRRLLDRLDIDHAQFTFVDLGCGKGKPLLIAAGYPFRRLIGVDISAVCIAVARANVERCGPKRIDPARVELLTMDVEDFVFPLEPLVVYLYNAFPVGLLERVVANLEASLRRAPREIVVVYVNPQAMVAFARSRLFVRVPTAADRMPALDVGVPRHERAVVFAARPSAAGRPPHRCATSRRCLRDSPLRSSER